MLEKISDSMIVTATVLGYSVLLLALWWAANNTLSKDNLTKIAAATDADGQVLKLPVWLNASNGIESIPLRVELPRHQFTDPDEIDRSEILMFVPRIDERLSVHRATRDDERPKPVPIEPQQFKKRASPDSIFRIGGTGPLVTGRLIHPLSVAGEETITLLLSPNGHGNALISPVYIGSPQELERPIRVQHFLNLIIRQINIGAGAVLAMLSLTFWALNRREFAFLWLGLGLVAFIGMNTGALSGVLPTAGGLSSLALSIIPMATLAAAFFAAYLTGQRVPNTIILLGTGIPITTVALIGMNDFDQRTTWLLLTFPATQICLANGAWMLLRNNVKHIEWDQLLIGCSFVGLMLTTAVDGLSRLGVIESLGAISPMAMHLTLLAIGLHIIRRQNQLLIQTSEMSVQKDLALKKQAEELHEESSRNAQLVRRNASLEEHHRLTAMLHAGVATNLSSIAVIQADSGLDPTIGLSARHGLFEVRLMANTTDGELNICETLLHYFSEVMLPTLARRPELIVCSRETGAITADLNGTLELTRIVHEIALVLRLANGADIARIELSSPKNDLLVHFFIVGPPDDGIGLGKAMTSPRIHAQSVGAEIFITPTAKDCRISLKIREQGLRKTP